ncbi:MAG: hypothetical protein DMG01_14585 [Acidobacteria bacterium]|nr:MAG: hypothetical protein DMG01_14585 [Acidobacteriota bacterium]
MTKRLKTALATRGHTEALKDGTVKPRSFDFEFEDVPVIINAFRRMVRNLDFDICELAMTTYLCSRAYGKAFTAIPVFPMRAFHHGAIVYNTNAGVRTPKDLEGKRVGVNRGYTVTTGLWVRSILQHEHGVDLSKVTWVLHRTGQDARRARRVRRHRGGHRRAGGLAEREAAHREREGSRLRLAALARSLSDQSHGRRQKRRARRES